MNADVWIGLGGIVIVVAGHIAMSARWAGKIDRAVDELRRDVDNDKQGRAAFQEVRTDVAVMKRDIEYIRDRLDKRRDD